MKVFLDLCNCLGIKANLRVGDAKLNGKYISKRYRVKFLSVFPVVKLPRKLNKQKLIDFRPTVFHKYISKIINFKKTKTIKIKIEGDSNFLIGKNLIPIKEN